MKTDAFLILPEQGTYRGMITRPVFTHERSVSDRVWRYRLDDQGEAQALAIQQEHGLSDALARILAGRGVRSSDLPAYLEPRLRDLMPDPLLLKDMDLAAARLADAVMRRESVAIFGDYDVDGACSSALLAEWLDHFALERAIHIPDRLVEGYGPNKEAITTLAQSGARLLVTVDCGTTSHDTLQEAKRLGMDVVVLDHHQAPVELPLVDALVNPNRQDDLSGLGHLCAAGVVFMTIIATTRVLRERKFFNAHLKEPDLLASLDLVALATIADVVPLYGLNRAFVRQGLAIARSRARIGLRALADVARLDGPITPFHLGFLIGPRINAGGRIGDAALGARLLLTQDEAEATAIASRLDQLNGERREIEKRMVEEAEAEALAMIGLDDDENQNVIVTASRSWHPGVVGLVASRLKDRFRRPSFAIALDASGLGTGSGRSLTGVDLGRAVRAAVDEGIIIKGGGHAMAAGVTIQSERIDSFREFLEARLCIDVKAARAETALLIDATLTAGGATAELVERIEKAGPFGSSHPEPIMAFSNHRLVDSGVVGQGHVRARFKSGDGSMIGAIAFRSEDTPMGKALLSGRGEAFHLAGTLNVDRYGGGERVQLRLVDIARVN